ncbi:MAG: SGNH/GDSL hydrolase family protein [Clostridia bacterium]|nr:SGNH/GDSL hydrolase family protein [Clostridia bacterium]
MKILMLGNSFTYFNDMPQLLAANTGWEVVAHTRGGAYLSEHLDPEAELGARTLPALREQKWDYVVLQEQSRGPYERREEYLASVRALCGLIRAAGATPVIYATWAYKDGTQRLASTGLSYDAMLAALTEGCHAAAKENGALIADAGLAFAGTQHVLPLYTPDDYHPSAFGSMLAALTIASCIAMDAQARGV